MMPVPGWDVPNDYYAPDDEEPMTPEEKYGRRLQADVGLSPEAWEQWATLISEIRREAYEDAAKIAESHSGDDMNIQWDAACETVAAAIRSRSQGETDS